MPGFSEWYLLDELEVLVEGKFQRGRPAPYCNNPDSPKFSDPGDPAKVDDVHVYLVKNGKRLDIKEWISDEMYKDICDDMLIEMEEVIG
jgi:hypothetical protein